MVIALFLALCGLAGCTDPSPPAELSLKIEAVLSTKTLSVAPNDRILFELTLTNHESEPVIVLRPDDCTDGWLTRWVIEDESGENIAHTGGGCGVADAMNAAEDIVTLQPGQSVTWTNDVWISSFSYMPGDYRVSLEYRHDPNIPSYNFGSPETPALWPLRQSKPFTVLTNAVNIKCIYDGNLQL